MTTNNTNESTTAGKNWSEEFEVAGNKLVEKVQELIAQGNARRIIIRKSDGQPMLDVPLTAGVAAGAIGLLIPGVRAVILIGSAVALFTQKFNVQVIRSEEAVVDADDVQHIKVEDVMDVGA